MKSVLTIATAAFTVSGLFLAVPAEANRPRHHYSRHGNCLRFNKTTGTVAGAVAGGLLGKVLLGGPVGVVAGAAAGGLAGHHFAHNRRKHC